MVRVSNAPTKRKRRRKILKQAKGYRGARSKLYKSAKETVMRALSFAYRDRKQRKRQFRSLWIIRINAAANMNGLSYSRFMSGLKKAGVALDRKVLADIAVHDEAGFAELAKLASQNVG
jgi:large subunit ribosomal protein L20